MRKLFLILCLPFIIHSQIPNQGFLVNSVEIGEDLMLFIPDSAVQILRNPARATDYSGEFIYINKIQDLAPTVVTVPLWIPSSYGSSIYRLTRRYSYTRWRPVLFSQENNDFNDPAHFSLAYLFDSSQGKWLLNILSSENQKNKKYIDDTDSKYLSESYSRFT